MNGRAKPLILIVIFTLALSILAGCGGGKSGGKSGGGNNPQPQTYTVQFNTDGGSSVTSMQVNSGSAISAPASPTRAGYAFEGWYSDSGRTNRVSFPYTVTRNTTLYAKWTLIPVIEIRTPADLDNVRNNLAGEYKLAADISLSAYANWEPIGTDDAPFTGKINGNGYKISGLKIDRARKAFVGLFGYIDGGAITNLALVNVNINGGGYSGSIAGYVTESSITGSYSTGNITSMFYAGGIVGLLLGGSISDCYSTGNIISLGAADTLLTYSGGIAGYMESGVITNCYSTGNIATANFAGGIVGGAVDDSLITDCYSTGSINSTSTSGEADEQFSGGIAGYLDNSAVTDSYSTGNVSSYSSSGGIAGFALDSVVNNSYSRGRISGEIDGGGIIAVSNSSAITNCYSTGNISGSEFSAGGIAGYIRDSAITNCYSLGNVVGLSAGGIAGFAYSDNVITNCAAINRTINSAASGRILGYTESMASLSISNNFAFENMIVLGAMFDVTDTMSNGIGKTDAQLKQRSTYEGAINGDGLGGLGWRFGNGGDAPWKMPPTGSAHPYPIFWWQ